MGATQLKWLAIKKLNVTDMSASTEKKNKYKYLKTKLPFLLCLLLLF
jgi:hypothetical protein